MSSLCPTPCSRVVHLHNDLKNYIPDLETNQFKIQDWQEISQFPFLIVCMYIWVKGLGKEESKFRTKCAEHHWVATVVHLLVVQPHFTLTTNLDDWLFLRVNLDYFFSFFFFFFFSFHTALVQCFCGNYVNYMSHHCIFSTSFDSTFKTNKRIIIFMGNLCFMV